MPSDWDIIKAISDLRQEFKDDMIQLRKDNKADNKALSDTLTSVVVGLTKKVEELQVFKNRIQGMTWLIAFVTPLLTAAITTIILLIFGRVG